MRTHEFKTGVWLPVPPEKIFPFFSNAANLDVLTPSWLHFRIMTPQPVEMRAGALIDYRLRIHGLPMRWRTLIKEWRPPHRFVDEQLRGPYRQWIHEHIFEPVDDGTLPAILCITRCRLISSCIRCLSAQISKKSLPFANNPCALNLE